MEDGFGEHRESVEAVVADLIRSVQSLKLAQTLTSYAYDSFMVRHKIIDLPDHVENSKRITKTFEFLHDEGILKLCSRINSRFASLEELTLVHGLAYIETLVENSTKSTSGMIAFQNTFDSVYFCSDTFKCASLAVGCLLSVVESVLTGESKNGFALIRPPGHHAARNEAAGFCWLSNVAIAAKMALKRYALKRVLIVDWDVHHGNGTQSVFYDSDQVLFISLHRRDNGSFYPIDAANEASDLGQGSGTGYSVNVPWNGGRVGDAEYEAAFKQIVLPIALAYKPELVLVSAGFDAALGDPLGGCRVTPDCFHRMTDWLNNLAGGKVVLALEGGYNTSAVKQSFAACARALLGQAIPLSTSPTKQIDHKAVQCLNHCKEQLAPYWPCLKND